MTKVQYSTAAIIIASLLLSCRNTGSASETETPPRPATRPASRTSPERRPPRIPEPPMVNRLHFSDNVMACIDKLGQASKTFTKALSRRMTRSKNLTRTELTGLIKPWVAVHRKFAPKDIKSHLRHLTIGQRLMKRYKAFYRKVGVFLSTLPDVLKIAYDDQKNRSNGKMILTTSIQTLAEITQTPEAALHTAVCNYVKAHGARPRSKRYIPCLTSTQKWIAKALKLKDDVCDKSNARRPKRLQRRVNAFIAKTKAAHVDKGLASRISKVTDKAQACVTALLPPKVMRMPRITP